MPVAATMPNMTSPAPPRTNCGIASTNAPIFGTSPSTIMMIPPATQTQRLRTPVTPTRPTFCEKLVYGKVLKRPPITVPRPSVRSPAASSFCPIGLPVISESARNIPVDSIMTTIITSDIVAIVTRSNVGMPNANGVTRSSQGALATLSKLILPIATATTQPTMMPIRTEMLATKPFVYLTRSRMTTRTKPATAMLSSAP